MQTDMPKRIPEQTLCPNAREELIVKKFANILNLCWEKGKSDLLIKSADLPVDRTFDYTV
jgi:hypothetical protein